MTQKEKEKIDKIIEQLDTAVGMMVVTAMSGNNPEIRTAMEKVRDASFDLTVML